MSIAENFRKLIDLANNNSQVEIVFSQQDKASGWQSVCAQLDFCPCEYDWANLHYQSEYFSAKLEASIVFVYQKKPIAIWPLMIVAENGNLALNSFGGDIREPLFLATTPLKLKKQLLGFCFKLLQLFAQEYPCQYQYRLDILSNGLSEWGRLLFDKCWQAEPVRLGYVALDLGIDNIKSHFRKSYRPLINAGLKKWTVDVQDSVTEDFERFHQLHIKVAGRVTRSEQSWALQQQMIADKKAFLVLLKDEAGDLIGGGFFTYNKTHCYYGVGVYRRDYFAYPLGHVVQYKAIEYMIALGIQWYELGELHSTINQASDKLSSISDFKSGFVTHEFVRLIFKHNYLCHQGDKS